MLYSLVFSVVQIVLGTSYNVVKVSVVFFLSKGQWSFMGVSCLQKSSHSGSLLRRGPESSTFTI